MRRASGAGADGAAEEGRDLLGGDRAAEEALGGVALADGEEAALLLGLDALGDDLSPSPWAISRSAATITAASRLPATSWTSERSILMPLTGRRRR
ncbi:MAG: hypothetical protein R2991_14285 [Thermoanaerobaculia bacterium]